MKKLVALHGFVIVLCGCGGGGSATSSLPIAPAQPATQIVQAPSPISAASVFAGYWSGSFVAGDQQGIADVTITTQGTASGFLNNLSVAMRGTMQGTITDQGNAQWQVVWENGTAANVSGPVHLEGAYPPAQKLIGGCHQSGPNGLTIPVTFTLSRR